MRSIRLIAVLGILAAASVVPSNHSPPPAPSAVKDLDRFVPNPASFATIAVYQQDLVVIGTVLMRASSTAAVPSLESRASAVALADRSGGAPDLAASTSTNVQIHLSTVSYSSRRWRGEHPWIPLRI
jgi:hypothetical protein